MIAVSKLTLVNFGVPDCSCCASLETIQLHFDTTLTKTVKRIQVATAHDHGMTDTTCHRFQHTAANYILAPLTIL